MMKTLISFLFLLFIFTSAQTYAEPITKIAFGSCLNQAKPAPILTAIAESQPKAFIFLGDNAYIDSEDAEVFTSKYAQLAAMPEFQSLKNATDLYAIWDDHDYGINDGGVEFPAKEIARQAMMDFFEAPQNDIRRTRADGIYQSFWIEDQGKRIHLILPDLRWNREQLDRVTQEDYLKTRKPKHTGPFVINPDNQMLGETQWQWLEKALLEPADLIILGSSIQVIPEFTGWESWVNFPKDRERLLSLIKQHQLNKLILISGDRHLAEISKKPLTNKLSLREVTSSSLNKPYDGKSPNVYRVGERYGKENYGQIEIHWETAEVMMSIMDAQGKVVEQDSLTLTQH